MSSEKTLKQTNDFASHYDEYISKSTWYGPQLMYGLLYEFISREQNLLDLGIGTGLSSLPFRRAGLNIYGVDGSSEMIKICHKKEITEDIRLANLENFKSPYGLALFDHALSIGVFHLVGHLESVFSEVSRSLVKGGTFSFTIDEYKGSSLLEFNETDIPGLYVKAHEDSGLAVYQHSKPYIQQLCKKHNFRIKRQTEFLGYRNEKVGREYYFSAFITQKL